MWPHGDLVSIPIKVLHRGQNHVASVERVYFASNENATKNIALKIVMRIDCVRRCGACVILVTFRGHRVFVHVIASLWTSRITTDVYLIIYAWLNRRTSSRGTRLTGLPLCSWWLSVLQCSARRLESTSKNRRQVRSVEMDIVNFGILKHPLNWVIVILMVMIFGIAAHLVLDFYNISPGK